MELTPFESYAFFKLELLAGRDLVSLAVQWMVEGEYSDSMCLLAAEVNPEAWIVESLFEATMKELGIIKPSIREAVKIALKHHLKRIVDGTGDPVDVGNQIYTDIYHASQEAFPDKNYVGDGIGIEHMCTWLREIWDEQDGSILLYYTDLPKEKAVEKFREHLVEEAGNLLKKLT